MTNPIKLFYCVLLALLVGCNQNKTVTTKSNNDSIKKYLDLASNDTLSNSQRNQCNKKAFSRIDLSKNDTLIRFYLSETSYNYLMLRNWGELKRISKIHLQKSIEQKDTLNIARYYRYQGGYYKNNQIFDSAFYCYSKSEKFYKKIKKIN